MINTAKCKHCGKCCYYLNTKAEWVPCRFLRKLNNYHYCRVYPTRLGTYVGAGSYCVKESPYNIPGCEFNKAGKPNHPYFKMQQIQHF